MKSVGGTAWTYLLMPRTCNQAVTFMRELRIGILTISDRAAAGERPDASGPALEEVINECGWRTIQRLVIPDDYLIIRAQLIQWAEVDDMDVILTTGGTGFSPRDVTPEATMSVVDRPAPGLAEAMRQSSLLNTTHAMLSRAAAGIHHKTLIVNLPGSPKGAIENFNVIIPVLPHAVELLRDDPGAEAGHLKNRA